MAEERTWKDPASEVEEVKKRLLSISDEEWEGSKLESSSAENEGEE